MALDRFRASPLPNPPAEYDPQYLRQVIRVLENYFSQLDSRAANNAEQYSADRFIGGSFSGTDLTANNVATTTLSAQQAAIGYLEADVIESVYTDTDALHAHSAEITTLMTDAVYGGYFYGDGRWVSTPYNQIISSSDQTAASVANAYAVTYDSVDYPDGISVTSSSRITFAQTGIYNITYSIQFKNTHNDVETIDIWLRQNGTDIADSNTRFAIPARKSAGDPSYLVAVTPIMVDITAANQYIEIMWRISNTAVTIEHLPAVTASPGVTPAIPATPSAIVGVTFISAQFPPVTRVAPLPVFGFGQIGTISVVTR
jgi:hypothetical protein